jgi:proline racemase
VGPVDVDLWPSGIADWLQRVNTRPLLAVDSHTAGNPTRVLLSGLDIPTSVASVPALRKWLADEADWVRTRLVHEPRGGGLTCAVVPLFGSDPDWDVGAVILEPGSYPPMCGHCMIGLSVVIADLNLLPAVVRRDADDSLLRILTPAGVVTSRLWRRPDGRRAVTLTNVASYPVASLRATTAAGDVDVDLVFGGDYYLTVDANELGLTLERVDAGRIEVLAQEIRSSCTAADLLDPVTGAALDVYQVMFYRQLEPQDAARPRARVVVVAPPAVIDRSPCGTGSSALLALLADRGIVRAGQTLTTESIIGSTFELAIAGAAVVDSRAAILPAITGTAFVNGFLTIVADPNDDLGDGFAPL